MAQSMVSFRMDMELKKSVEEVCSEMGLSLTTAFTLFAKKLSRDRRIPFEITAEVPKDVAFQTFMEGINGFTDDCFTGNRELNVLPTEREEL